jgi:hypothetical protein
VSDVNDYNKIKLMKNHEVASSVVMSDSPNRSIASNETRQGKRKIPYKIEYCNQNLEDAIKEVRSSVRDNPEWRLNVKAVVSQYPPSKDRASFINDSQRLDGLQQQLPLSNKMAFPITENRSTF